MLSIAGLRIDPELETPESELARSESEGVGIENNPERWPMESELVRNWAIDGLSYSLGAEDVNKTKTVAWVVQG